METPMIERCTLANGLRVIHAQCKSSRAFSISMHIQAGSRDETQKNNGIFHFLEHMMFRGSQKFPNSVALAHALETLGGENNGYTDYESSAFWIKGSSQKISSGLDVFSEFFFNATFPDIETERQILLQELASDYNDEGNIICPTTLAMSALFRDHSLGMPVIGNRENIMGLTNQDLQSQRTRFYQPASSILVVSSPFSLAENIKLIECNFSHAWTPKSHWKRNYVPPEFTPGITVATENHSDSQLDVRLIFPAAGGLSPQVIAQTFLQRLLDDGIASRLPSSIREKAGLAYDISCDISTFSDVGTCSIDASISDDGFAPFLKILRAEIVRLLNQTPSESEMDRVRNRYVFALETLEEDTSAYLDYLVWNSFLGRESSPECEREMVLGITAEHVREAAQAIFTAPRRAAALVGPDARGRKQELEQFLAELGATVAP